MEIVPTARAIDLGLAPTNALRDREMLLRGFPGFPGAFNPSSAFKPPRARARASTELQVQTINGQTVRSFYLDVPGFQGMSGGPVSLASEVEITQLGDGTGRANVGGVIIGIIVETVGDASGGKFAKVSHIHGVLELIAQFENGLHRLIPQSVQFK